MNYLLHHRHNRAESARQLDLLISHLREYDLLRQSVAYRKASMEHLSEMMKKPLPLQGWHDDKITLCTPIQLKDAVSQLDFGIALDIRKYENFPTYFLFRHKTESYRNHYVLLEEIYRSPSYNIEGHRFVRLKPRYEDRMYLNAIPYRSYIASRIKKRRRKRSKQRRINEQLNRIGKILNLAWDEDFDLTRQICMELKIEEVISAMELTCLVLCTEDFTWLRNQQKEVEGFFNGGYDHPFLGNFLDQLPMLEARDWRKLVDRAKKDYVALRRGIAKLYRSPVAAIGLKTSMPLWKVAFSHYNKDMPPIAPSDSLQLSIQMLRNTATGIIDSLTSVKNH